MTIPTIGGAASMTNPAPLTKSELDTVPHGTVVRSADGTIACRYDDSRGVLFGDERPFLWSVLRAPAIILWPLTLDESGQP